MKMASQRFCLRWNNHQSNLLSVFDQLLHAETFTDVTLAVEGQYLRAHKMVLSACSPYFNALFINHPEKHPIVILKDVPYTDMKSLLDFMYRGEVSVDQERLTAFLRVAESLRIKGLTEVNDDKPTSNEIQPTQIHRIQPYLVQQQNKNTYNQSQNISSLSSLPKRKRGRPRKLSGSSNGTGDYDDYDQEDILNDDFGSNKLNDALSAQEDASDDYRRDSDHNENTIGRKKRNKGHKDVPTQINQNDNSTSGVFAEDKRKFYCDAIRLSLNAVNPSLTPSIREERNTGIAINKNDYKVIYNEEVYGRDNFEPNESEELKQDGIKKQVLTTVLQSKIDIISPNEEKQREQFNDSNDIRLKDRSLTQEERRSPELFFDLKDKSEDISYTFLNHQKEIVSTSPLKLLFIKSTNKLETVVKAGELGATTTTSILDISSSTHEPTTSVTKRRMRRKAQSTIDDQAEHLTEMSVRGLDLFRYASINNGVYQCTECAKGNIQKTFKNKYSFQRHAFLYHEGKHRKVFPCNVCGKEFSRPDKMKNHIKMTHESFALKDLEQGREINYLKSIDVKDIQNRPFKQRFQQKKYKYQYSQEETSSMTSNEIGTQSENYDNHILSTSSIIPQQCTSEPIAPIQHLEQHLN